jgi:hypothetical protein
VVANGHQRHALDARLGLSIAKNPAGVGGSSATVRSAVNPSPNALNQELNQ